MVQYKLAQKDLNCDQSLPVFASEAYLKCKSKSYGWFESENYLIPFVIQKKIAFKWLTFTYKPIEKCPNLSPIDQKEFLQQIISFVQRNKFCDFINKAQAYVVFDAVPDGCDAIEYGTYQLGLQKTDDEIIMNCHAKHRNKIRKATRDGISIKETNDVRATYQLIKETMKRANSVFYPSLNYLSQLKKRLPNNVKFFIAEKSNVLQGVAVVVFDEFTGYYLFGGSKPKPATGALNLMQFEIFKHLRDKGVYNYDFVGARINVQKGSKQEGIQNFKIRFGGVMHRGYTFRHVIKPLKFSMFRLSAKIYGILTGDKYRDVIDQVKKEIKYN